MHGWKKPPPDKYAHLKLLYYLAVANAQVFMSQEQRKEIGMASRLEEAINADLTGQPMPDPERDKMPEWKLERERRADAKLENIARLKQWILEADVDDLQQEKKEKDETIVLRGSKNASVQRTIKLLPLK